MSIQALPKLWGETIRGGEDMAFGATSNPITCNCCKWAGGCYKQNWHCECGWSGKISKMVHKSTAKEYGNGSIDRHDYYHCPKCQKCLTSVGMLEVRDSMEACGYLIKKINGMIFDNHKEIEG